MGQIFKPGDLVKIEGVLEANESSIYPLKLKAGGNVFSFTLDGKIHTCNTSPVLIMVKPATKKVKKWRWVIGDSDGPSIITISHYSNYEEYLRIFPNTEFIFIQKIDSTEIEVEDL